MAERKASTRRPSDNTGQHDKQFFTLACVVSLFPCAPTMCVLYVPVVHSLRLVSLLGEGLFLCSFYMVPSTMEPWPLSFIIIHVIIISPVDQINKEQL